MANVEQLVDITGVAVIGDYRLRLRSRTERSAMSTSPRDWRGVFEPLRDPEDFARVTVDPEAGAITWPDGLDMAPEPLYAEARRHLVRDVTAAS
jgi:hypothetical protein